MGEGLKRAVAASTATRLDDVDRLVLRRTPADEAFWTSDVAHDCRLETRLVRRRLDRLAKAHLVERVVVGNPTSWRRTDAGTAALTAAS